MKQVFGLPEVDHVLHIEAKNAFNELNCQVTLRGSLCFSCSHFYTYCSGAYLFTGGHNIFSSEGLP